MSNKQAILSTERNIIAFLLITSDHNILHYFLQLLQLFAVF